MADAAADTSRPSTDYPDELWTGTQELVGHTTVRAKPRLVVADWLPEHGIYDGQHLGGCFDKDRWAVQIIPSVMAGPMPELLLMHELAHAALDEAGMPGPDQHCAMSKMNYQAQAAKWLYDHGFRVNLVVIGAHVLNELAICEAQRNG